MGIIETKQIKSAIKKDGSQNVKKSAFIHGSFIFLQNQKETIKQKWQEDILQLLNTNKDFIERKKLQIQKILDVKQTELQGIDIQFIEKIEKRTGKSFNEISGFKKANKKLAVYQQLLDKIWKEEIGMIQVQINQAVQKIKQNLSKQAPQLPALDLLGDEIKYKIFQKYIEDDAFEIQRQRYNGRAIREFEKLMDFDQIIEQRFRADQVEQEVNKIVDEFKQKLKELNSFNGKCAGFC